MILKKIIKMKIVFGMILFSFGLFRKCKSEPCDIKVTDNTKENSFISNLNSFDVYSTPYTQNKKFNLLSNTKANRLFHLHSNGKLYSAQTIDREELCINVESCCHKKDPCDISLSIAVKSDSIEEPRTFECRIQIEDINDNAPRFRTDKFTINIKESEPVGSLFSLPIATDDDSEQYSIRDYKLEENSIFPPIFSLEQNRPTGSLNLQLIQKLDREKRAKYEFVLLAIDRGNPPKTGRLVININVLDVNDNPPHLSQTNYNIQYEESKFSMQPLLKIGAKDEDENDNAKMVFKIVNEQPVKVDANKYFRIEENSGNIYLKEKLDYERDEQHRFYVEVSNNAGHVDTATATVLIQVINLNDETPEIAIDYVNENNKNAFIKENEDQKTKFVALATVTDKDKGLGGQVHCRLSNNENVFEIHNRDSSIPSNKYSIRTRVTLDRETKGYYELQMECEDKGDPPLRAKALIKVVVKDENDNAPVIKLENNVSVYENKPIGTLVTHITAKDIDEGKNGELTYSISESSDLTKKYLEINSHTGDLKTRMKIDREQDSETLQSFPVILTVSDKGQPPQISRKAFDVSVKDENDNAPEFENYSIQFQVTENQQALYTLGEIRVHDKDDNSQLRVSLVHLPNEMSSPFVLFERDNKYYLNTTRSLDWEKEKNYSFKILASDGTGYKSHTATATVTVIIEDENDHAPSFIFPNYSNFTKYISYHESAEIAILTVSVGDLDSKDSMNGKCSFHLVNDHKGLFKIDQNKGKITTSRTMSESDMGKHVITVIARDHGNPPKESSILITIVIDNSKPFSIGQSNENNRDPNYVNKKFSGHFIMTKESFLITSLIILLLFLLLCIFIILYMRHIRGLFPMLPDIFEGCNCFSDKRNSQKKNLMYNKSVCEIPINENKHFTSSSSPLEFQQGRNNESTIMPFYFNQYDTSISTSPPHPIDQKLSVNQYRQYETMKYQHYSAPIMNTNPVPNYNYDQLCYHHPRSSPCEESFSIPNVNPNNVYDSRIKAIPSSLHRDLVTCHRIVNNIDPSPLISEELICEVKKERFSSNPCLKSDITENFVTDTSLTKTPDVRRHSKSKTDKIDTYAVTYPKEQSTFV